MENKPFYSFKTSISRKR